VSSLNMRNFIPDLITKRLQQGFVVIAAVLELVVRLGVDHNAHLLPLLLRFLEPARLVQREQRVVRVALLLRVVFDGVVVALLHLALREHSLHILEVLVLGGRVRHQAVAVVRFLGLARVLLLAPGDY